MSSAPAAIASCGRPGAPKVAGVGTGAVRQDQARRAEPGFRLRIVDGNHLPASEKRLEPVRRFHGAALPGHSLVVYDPDREIVVDLEPCEDAHAQERAVMTFLLERARPGE